MSRLRARFNEQTIVTLETTLKDYKQKIVNLETQLRSFGVDLKDGNSVKIDFNEFLKNSYLLCESLDNRLDFSENTIQSLSDLIPGSKSPVSSLKEQRRLFTTKRKYRGITLQDTFQHIEVNLNEINEKLNLFEHHENLKQETITILKDYRLKEIEKQIV